MRIQARSVCCAALATLGVAAAAPAHSAELAVEWAPLAVQVESYQVERRVDSPRAGFAPIARVGGTATRFTDATVLAGVRYCYRVRGIRGGRLSRPSPELCSVATERSALQQVDARSQTAPSDGGAPEPPAPSAHLDPVATAGADAVGAARAEPGRPQDPSGETAAVEVPDPSPATEPIASAVSPREAPPPSVSPAIADRDVKALRRPRPSYPPEARLGGLSGWVKLRFTVTAQGTTRDIVVTAAEPPGVFDQAAIEAAQRFEYSPRTENGVAVDRPNVETEITFTWISRGGELIIGPRPLDPR